MRKRTQLRTKTMGESTWKKRDKTIYLACIGWILLDLAIVIGVLVNR